MGQALAVDADVARDQHRDLIEAHQLTSCTRDHHAPQGSAHPER
jgi:hypothetical protein